MRDEEQIAKWMGWRPATPEESLKGLHGDEEFIGADGELHDIDYESLDSLRVVEAEINHRQLSHYYVDEVRRLILLTQRSASEFDVMTASPQIRVWAMASIIQAPRERVPKP